MAAPTWFFISFMVLLSLAICSSQTIDVHTIKSKEADHHHHKLTLLSNIDVQRFGGGRGGGGGFGIVGGGGFGIGIGGDGRFGIDIGGVVPAYNDPGYGSPIYIPGFDFPIYSPACGYVCPANNPSGEITEFKISGLPHLTRPYRCRPGPNMRGDKDYNQELLLHFVSTMQDKHENKQQRLHYGGHGGDAGHLVGGSRRLGFGRGSGSSDTSDQYDTEDPGSIFDGCGYVCPGNSPSGGITEFHISGLSHFNGPYRCRQDMCDTEDCGEFLLHFVSPMHNKHENQHGHQSEQ
ncbi:anther-specific protein TA-29-like [Solanum dulcamara]|uniref:anther-specific protein TA-29-like n=1 Tax=Solanum dulcamara TaxID=45834 RepID=UPI00248588A9|nr:anther-specific protein TA-29-like [Solanum dulcamara]